MAETLTELVAKIKTDASGLEKGLTDAEKQTEASSKKMQDSLKKVGIAMAASGAAITAALGLMGKAAIAEDINIKRLAGTLGTIGVSYDTVKDSLEAVIAATQRKTGIADDEQRDMLSRLILITQDYDAALKLMPIALDLAADAQMDTTTAATYLSKAYLDLQNGAEEVSVRFGMAAIKFKSLEDIQARVAGKAEALVNPFNVLSATMGDVSEAIGLFLIPTIKDLVNKFVAVSDGIQKWIKLNPELVGQIVLSTLKLGLLLLVIGSFIILLIQGIKLVTTLTSLMGPWGLAIIAASILITYLVAELLGLNEVLIAVKDIMAEVKNQMFIMRAEQALSIEEWAEIKEQGYLTEQQFINLAKAMEITTEELYDQMEASGMLQVTMSSLGDTNIYLVRNVNKVATALNSASKASENVTGEMEAMKQSIAHATWQADGYTYSMQLFTQAEIDAAKASGKKVEELKNQSDITADNIEKAKEYKEAIDDSTESVKALTKALELKGKITGVIGGASEEAILAYQRATIAAGWGPSARAANPPGWEAAKAGIVLQHGGIVTQPTMALIGEAGAEAVVPLNEGLGGITINFTQPVFFDREDTMNRFVDIIRKGIQRQDRLRFGGAYSG